MGRTSPDLGAVLPVQCATSIDHHILFLRWHTVPKTRSNHHLSSTILYYTVDQDTGCPPDKRGLWYPYRLNAGKDVGYTACNSPACRCCSEPGLFAHCCQTAALNDNETRIALPPLPCIKTRPSALEASMDLLFLLLHLLLTSIQACWLYHRHHRFLVILGLAV